MTTPIRVFLEVTPKKAFASALDWPGLSRAGRDRPGALAALADAMPRYGLVAAAAGFAFDANAVLEVVEEAPGDAATAFGVPSIVAADDRVPTTAGDGERLGALVAACWAVLDAIAATAPEDLRKGPRGGGRNRDKVVGHVADAEAAYTTVMGLRQEERTRSGILALLRKPSDGAPLAGKRWPVRYAARRVAWHVLDHAWEIEDRAEPGD
jgi:hypothetical protein